MLQMLSFDDTGRLRMTVHRFSAWTLTREPVSYKSLIIKIRWSLGPIPPASGSSRVAIA